MESFIICNVVFAILGNEMVYEYCSSVKQMAFMLFGTCLNSVNSKFHFCKCPPHLVLPYSADDWMLIAYRYLPRTPPTHPRWRKGSAVHAPDSPLLITVQQSPGSWRGDCQYASVGRTWVAEICRRMQRHDRHQSWNGMFWCLHIQKLSHLLWIFHGNSIKIF